MRKLAWACLDFAKPASQPATSTKTTEPEQFFDVDNSTLKCKEIYDAMEVDCHHSLRSCGDKMKMSLPKIKKKKYFFLRKTPNSPCVPFRAKFHPSGPLAYSLVLTEMRCSLK